MGTVNPGKKKNLLVNFISFLCARGTLTTSEYSFHSIPTPVSWDSESNSAFLNVS